MKKLLIVIDMQKDFIDGALGTPEAAANVPKVREKILSYPPEAVYATMDTHSEDYLSTQEGRRLPVVHCLRGTEGWALDPALAPGQWRELTEEERLLLSDNLHKSGMKAL